MNTKGLETGLGIRGITGAIVLGFICLFQPLFGDSSSFLWAKILLVLAAIVYVAFSLMWDLWHLASEKRYVPWWYAGACVYVDLAAVLLIILTRN